MYNPIFTYLTIQQSESMLFEIYSMFSQVLVCYYTIPGDLNTSWELSPSHIDPHICTHIIVGFAGVVNNTLDIGNDAPIYERVVALKNLEPNLKVMISAGGNNELHNGFSEMVKNHANRKKYVHHAAFHSYNTYPRYSNIINMSLCSGLSSQY